MSLTSQFLPPLEFSEHETEHIAFLLSDPAVVKYLKSMAQEDSRELLELGTLGMSDEAVARRHTLLTGKLVVISTLLSISQPK